MRFKKSAAIVLCITQLSFGFTSSGTQTSPEFSLLQNVIALEGQNLSQDTMTARLGTVLTQYETASQNDGRADRLKQAMVSLGVYTADQADQFVTDAMEVAASAANPSDTGAMLTTLMSRVPQGAQFSYCLLGGGFLTVFGGVALFVGLLAKGLTVDGNGNQPLIDGILIGGGVGTAAGIGLVIGGATGGC